MARELVVRSGLRKVDRYVDSYTLLRRSLDLFAGLVEALKEAAGESIGQLGEALVAVADEVGSGAPYASPVFNVSLALQTLYDELMEAEASPELAWLALEKLVGVVREYVDLLPKRVTAACSSLVGERARVSVVGGGALLLHCLKGLPKHSTVVILEGYPERDGYALYKRLREERGDLRLILLPDAYYWQAARDTDLTIVFLDGVGRDCVALARAGSRPLSLVAKAVGREAAGVTFLLAVEGARMLRGTPRPEKTLRLHEVGAVYSSPVYDYLEVNGELDRVATEAGEVKPDGSTLVAYGFNAIMEMVGRAFRQAAEELGIEVKPPEELEEELGEEEW